MANTRVPPFKLSGINWGRAKVTPSLYTICTCALRITVRPENLASSGTPWSRWESGDSFSPAATTTFYDLGWVAAQERHKKETTGVSCFRDWPQKHKCSGCAAKEQLRAHTGEVAEARVGMTYLGEKGGDTTN